MTTSKLVEELIAIVGADRVIWTPEDLIVYECDGLTLERTSPKAVVFPESVEEVSRIVKFLNASKVPFAPRGAGTGLSGGCLSSGVIIELSKMDKILEIDIDNQRVTVQPAVTNLMITQAVSNKGYYYVPDPSSQQACTIGGNVAENSGGAHCLKYGVTTNYILGLEMVLPDGSIVEMGGKELDWPGYDLVGLMNGSEGTLGIITKIVVRLLRQPEAFKTIMAVYDTIDDASNTVSGIIAQGILPAALEMMDHFAIEAVEGAIKAGYPTDAGSILLIELDGLKDGMDELAEQIVKLCQANHVRQIKIARTPEERALIWKGRKSAFGAIGRISPNYAVQDGVVPRSKLPEVLKKVDEIGRKYSIRIANVFHAGDGNLHPLLLYDERDQNQVERVLKASSEILKACADAGGSISGEHGIGLEKREEMKLIFSADDIETMQKIKSVFDPEGLCNPDKIFSSKG